MAVRYDIAVGLNKGFKTTKIRRVTYKGDKKIKGLRGSNVKNVSVKPSDLLVLRAITSKQFFCQAKFCKKFFFFKFFNDEIQGNPFKDKQNYEALCVDVCQYSFGATV